MARRIRIEDRVIREQDALIASALKVLEERLSYGVSLSAPADVKNYLRLRLGGEEREVFTAVWLDAQNRVRVVEDLFVGTLTQTSVYPREVVKSALRHNACSVVFSHNHPSGVSEPSTADRNLTRHLTDALAHVDVRVLDHIIVTASDAVSFAERGYI